jgi:short subunit fatty acids transporter
MRLRLIFKTLGLLLLGLWLGAALFFSAAVAPNVFAVLRGAELANASTLAGSIVTRLLGIINHGGFEISLFLLIVSFFVTRYEKRWIRFAEMISLAIMAMMTGIGHWVIAARMSDLRAAMLLPLEQVPAGDPRRMEFDTLHRYSVAALGVAMIAALIAFLIKSRGSGVTVSEDSPKN